MIQSIEEDRKFDGERSIADKIVKRLDELGKTADTNYGRWAWELLQNAKDSVSNSERQVDVLLQFEGDVITFAHNGNHFTGKDVRGLINQISSKEPDEGEISTNVGRFGTGFLTTHLLSKQTIVKGIVQVTTNELYQFEFPLDREANSVSQLTPKIQATWAKFHQSTKRVYSINPDYFNTSFQYILSNDKQKAIAIKGLDEFSRLLPYVLTFIPKIGQVTLVNNGHKLIFQRNKSHTVDGMAQVFKTEDNNTSSIYIAISRGEKVSVAIEVDASENCVKELIDVPKVFCDFPLVGTEKFPFPAVVHSFYFTPQPERDGIWLTNIDDEEIVENKSILVQALERYNELLNYLSNSTIKKLCYVCDTRMREVNEKIIDVNWYKEHIQSALRRSIISINVVDTIHLGRMAIDDVDKPVIDFPHHVSRKGREQLWELGSKLNKEALILPERDSIEFWDEILWDKSYYLDLHKFAVHLNDWICWSIEKLNIFTGGSEFSFEWLNHYYTLIIEENELDLFYDFQFVPDQNGDFHRVNGRLPGNKFVTVLYNDEINDNVLLDILYNLGTDWKRCLIHDRVSVNLTSASLTKVNIANAITKSINDYKSKKTEDYVAGLEFVYYNKKWDAVKAIVMLSEWFDENEELGKELFPEWYRKKAELVLSTIEDKESLYKVMKSKTPLSTIAWLADIVDNDPGIIQIIKQRQQEIEEEKERNEIGEAMEIILAEVLRDYGFTVTKVHRGRDLVISITGKFNYDIEVKSTSSDSFVAMTPAQAKTAVSRKEFYALCVVQKDQSELTKEYVRDRARFVTNIGSLIESKVIEMQLFDSGYSHLFNNHSDVSLFLESPLKYKYAVDSSIWSEGLSLEDFVNWILGKD